jgi:hypothetical protein
MGVGYNPRIVTDGLVLCLDAANPRSAPTTAIESAVVSSVTGSGPSYNVVYTTNVSAARVGDKVNVEKREAGAGTSSTVLSTYTYEITGLDRSLNQLTLTYESDTASLGDDSPADLPSGGGSSGSPEIAPHDIVSLWIDMKGGNNGTPTNSPTFNNNGSLSHFFYSSANDNIKITESNTLNFQPTQPFSVFCWFKKDAFGGSNVGAIISNMKSSFPYPGWDIWCQSSSLIAMHLISTWSANAIKIQVYHDYSKISYVGFTYDGSCPANSTESLSSVNFYRDGLLNTTNKALSSADGFNSSSESISYPAGQQSTIGSRDNGDYTSSYVYSAHIYNRALSAKEVLQNYEATKGRYA